MINKREIFGNKNAGYTIIEAEYTDNESGYAIGKNEYNYVTWWFHINEKRIDYYHGHYTPIEADSPFKSRARAYEDYHNRLSEAYNEIIKYGR